MNSIFGESIKRNLQKPEQAEQCPRKQQLIFVYADCLGNIFNGVRKNTVDCNFRVYVCYHLHIDK